MKSNPKKRAFGRIHYPISNELISRHSIKDVPFTVSNDSYIFDWSRSIFMNLHIRYFLLLASITLTLSAEENNPIERITKVTHPELNEMSGIVASKEDGIYWVHNDSGDEARIFAIDIEGRVQIPNWIDIKNPHKWDGHQIDAAWHNDWEDIALDDGTLYIGDVGNNGNARRDLGVYVVNEFNPSAVTKTRSSHFLPIRYPDQEFFPARNWLFDCEAIFTFEKKLYFLTKHRKSGQISSWEFGTKLYRLDTQYTDKDNVLTLIDKHPLVSLVTGADVSPNGNLLAIVTYTRLWVFERPEDGDSWLQAPARILDLPRDLVKQNEAVTWESDKTILITNENRDLFRIYLDSLIEFSPENTGQFRF